MKFNNYSYGLMSIAFLSNVILLGVVIYFHSSCIRKTQTVLVTVVVYFLSGCHRQDPSVFVANLIFRSLSSFQTRTPFWGHIQTVQTQFNCV